ncbi:MAG TPA: hypothetical protein VGB26_13315 [Nitrospiria bacterium]|jgi:hypothetical protein
MEQKLVVHFQDGKILKGVSHDFFPNKNCFHLGINHQVSGVKPLAVYMSELKAVFFVKDFVGDKEFNELKDFSASQDSTYGKKIMVHLKDGESLCGFTQGYSPNRQGFFLFPLDSQSNNLKAFILQSFIKKVDLPD